MRQLLMLHACLASPYASAAACVSRPDRLFGPAAVISTSASAPNRSPSVFHMHRLQKRRTADQLAGLAPGPVEQNVHAPADTRLVERRLLRVQEILERGQPFRLDLFGDLAVLIGGRRARAGRIFERIGLGIVDVAHQRQGRCEIGIGLAGKADDEVGRQGNAGTRGGRMRSTSRR